MADLLTVLDSNLRRVASTDGDEYAGPCPFCGGHDRFRVWPNAAHPHWWCRQCGKRGDAVDYLREREGLTYQEACERLGAVSVIGAYRQEREVIPAVATEAARPTWKPGAALAVVSECEAALWTEAGAKARDWLHGRGLADDTIRAWRLGYNPTDGRRLHGLRIPRGIVIPCFVDGAVQYVKVRRPVPPLPGPKYQHVAGGKPALFGLDRLSWQRVAVICEGELDAILLHQEAGDLVDVVALGSKGTHPALPWLARLLTASRWLVALDCDADDAAAWWGEFSPRVRRVRPLQGNDVTEFHQAGGDLRAWVVYHLERNAEPVRADHEQADSLGDLDPLIRVAVEELGAVVQVVDC